MCDKGNIDLLLDTHPSGIVADAANSFAWLGADHIAGALRTISRQLPGRSERDLGGAMALVRARTGYGYTDIADAVLRWGVPG